jgi:hypothetical protein
VADRFDYGVRYMMGGDYDSPLVIGSHGMAMTVWLSSRLRLADPAAFWSDLRLPDVLVVNLKGGTVGRLLSTQMCWQRSHSTASKT